jgi:glycosyltransferase involved in cell wall biosynthesis
MYDHYLQNHPDTNVYFAPPGVDASTYHPVNGDKNEASYILSVGCFSRARKNVKLLFEAYYRLRQKNSDPPRLVLAGRDAPNPTAWEAAQSLGITEHIDVHVDVPEEKLTRLYRHADLFALSSKEEGLGLVIAEAMASGVPVVSTDCGGPSTLIAEGKTGYLTPVGDPDALADRMQTVLENPDHARELGERGRARIEEHFSEEAAGQKFLEVYDQLLE